MKSQLLVLYLCVCCLKVISAQTIWTGSHTTFTKANFADPTLEANQDRITDHVWITRGDIQGIFNIKKEGAYSKTTGISPIDTEWAFGTTDNWESLTYNTWVATIENNPPDMLNRNMVLHLITDDIYIDLEFTSWSIGNTAGGGFSYHRSTDSSLNIDDYDSITGIQIYPNPAQSFIHFKHANRFDIQSLKITTILGQQIFNYTILESGIEVSNLKNGVYFLHITTISEKQVKRFIKQ
ncbi:T9SS type A sorting domain-containing protein [Aestuariivivens sediminis]|uniref:T9SS type A sorting domain-containing protein n=1 Tax=Aestuariivivens sediminis TaxID=2913557 RepID=UPI001F5A9831|nr:T9SS type A sorting domain-containing protein [Aestuariivivens sediminis]